MDDLGPFTVDQLRRIAADYRCDAEVFSAIALDDRQMLDILGDRTPLVLLWRDTPEYGHFILLHWRKNGIELFDPVGTTSKDEAWATYMDDPKYLNGGGLRPLLQALDTKIPLSFNPDGPQDSKTFSCGLWCLLRAKNPCLPPSKFAKAV